MPATPTLMSNQSVYITYKKGNQKPSSSVIKRNDGSEVFIQYKPKMVYHDLAHFAIESALMRKSGFYWLINLGLKPEDFELPKKQQPELLTAAMQETDNIAIEYMANQLMVEALNSGPIDNFLEVLKQGIRGNGDTQYSFPLSEAIVEDIRELYRIIIDGWKAMKEGQEKKVMVFYPDEDDRPEEL